jgi:hypothetical protein
MLGGGSIRNLQANDPHTELLQHLKVLSDKLDVIDARTQAPPRS